VNLNRQRRPRRGRFPQVDLLADGSDRIANFPCDASEIIGRDAQPPGPGPDLGGISQIDLVGGWAEAWRGASGASPNDAV